MAIGVRVELELEQQLDQLAHSMGKSRSACVWEAIGQYVSASATPMKRSVSRR